MKHLSVYLFFLLILSGSLLLQNCNRDPDDDDDCQATIEETVNLTTDELGKVPYSGYDTLFFLNKQGDTCIVRGAGKQFAYEEIAEYGRPSCPPLRYMHYQNYVISFLPIKGNMAFDLIQDKKSSLVNIYKGNNQRQGIYFLFEYNLLGTKSTTGQYYFDTLAVNNEKYGGVYQFLLRKDGVNTKDTAYTLFFNHTHGILLLKDDNLDERFSIIHKP